MNHSRRGIAVIFNHEKFDEHLGLSVRNGTDVDQDNLLMTLQQLDFEVKVYKDLPYKEIENILKRLSRDNHSDADCLFLAVLSHGDQGLLYAFDQPYKAEQLWSHFTAEKCSTLAGKPKLFFVQVPTLKITHKVKFLFITEFTLF